MYTDLLDHYKHDQTGSNKNIGIASFSKGHLVNCAGVFYVYWLFLLVAIRVVFSFTYVFI